MQKTMVFQTQYTASVLFKPTTDLKSGVSNPGEDIRKAPKRGFFEALTGCVYGLGASRS